MIGGAIARLVEGRHLSESEMESVMNSVMSGSCTPAQIAALLTALRIKGETVEEIAAAARVMKEKATKVPVSSVEDLSKLVDTCGTGGDGTGTFNVSTAAAFIAAGAGVRVAKHGNRSVSSRCGSADVMEALGIRIDIGPEDVGRCVDEVGIGFLFAPRLHSAMKHAIGPRREIGIRTIFNILGPLTNPAGAKAQVMGVFREELTETMAKVLAKLGCTRALVVHGSDGTDEITITGPTKVSELSDGRLKTYMVSPEDFGLKRRPVEEIMGGDAVKNARIVASVLSGEEGACTDMAMLNAAAAILVAGAARDMKEGLEMARYSVESGRAAKKLRALASLTQKIAGGGA